MPQPHDPDLGRKLTAEEYRELSRRYAAGEFVEPLTQKIAEDIGAKAAREARAQRRKPYFTPNTPEVGRLTPAVRISHGMRLMFEEDDRGGFQCDW